MHDPIPALVVSGFLGSGKTTVVQHLLADAQQRGIRVAVVTNEFGALGIDKSLLGSGGEAYVELDGGCVCCELSDDLVNTLQQLWEDVQPERVIVETSGVALPFDTQINFWREPVAQWIGDDMAVVVVNAEQVWEGRDLEGTFEDQVTSADLLIVNKTDLVPDDATTKIEEALRALEPDAPIVHVSFGSLDPRVLFPPEQAEARAERRTQSTVAPHSHEVFESETLRIAEGVSPAVLTEQLQQLGALRAKGYVQLDEGIRLVQVVGRRVEISAPNHEPPPELLGTIVVIRKSADGSVERHDH